MTTMYAVTPEGLLVIRQRADGWQTEFQLGGKPTQCLAVDAQRPERVYCGTQRAGLYTSDDAGASWSAVDTQLSHEDVLTLAVSTNEISNGYGVVYAGTEPAMIYRSEDGGVHWHKKHTIAELPSAPEWSFPPRPETSHVRAIALDPHVAGTIYVAIEAGALVRSTDGGDTWIDRVADGPYDTHTLLMHPRVPGRLYSVASDGLWRPGREVSISEDGGETWHGYGGNGIEYHYGWGMALDPVDPETIIISVSPGPNNAHNPRDAWATIYRKTAGQAWQESTAGLPPPRGSIAYALAADPVEPGIFYAFSNHGVFRSADAGQSWAAIPVEWHKRYEQMRMNEIVVTA